MDIQWHTLRRRQPLSQPPPTSNTVEQIVCSVYLQQHSQPLARDRVCSGERGARTYFNITHRCGGPVEGSLDLGGSADAAAELLAGDLARHEVLHDGASSGEK